jgi:hypothetical protein
MKRTRLGALDLAALAFAIGAAVGNALAGDWPQFMRCPERTGDVADEKLRMPLGPVARVRLEDAIPTSPGLVGGRGPTRGVAVYRDMVATLYLKGSDGAMAYLCPQNGEPAMKQVGGGWRRRAAFGAPAFNGDWLFFSRWFGGGVGVVNLREERSYSRRFQSGAWGCLEAPLVTRDIMILATIRGTIEAYSIHDGKTSPKKLWEWKTPSGKMFHAFPAAAGGSLVVGNDDGCVYGFRYSQLR